MTPRPFGLALAFALLIGTPAFAACPGADLVARLREVDPSSYAAFEAAGRRTPNAEGLLWKIERPGLAASHLFGTIHVSDARLAPLPFAVAEAVASARAIVVEPRDIADPEASAGARILAGRRALRPGGKSLFAVPPEDRQVVINMLAARGLLEPSAQRLEPWFLAMLASAPPCEIARIEAGGSNVDQMVVEAGRKVGATIEGLEDSAEQIETLAAIGRELSIRMLVDTARLGSDLGDFLETMVGLYRDRRIGFLAAAFRDLELGGPRMATQLDYLDALLADRNARMHARARERVAEGGAFVAVGAMHLVGQDGLVERFRSDGYEVTRLW